MNIKQWTVYILILYLFSPVLQADPGLTLDKLINKYDPSANIGIAVMDMEKQKIIYQRNANKLFIPASNMKLFSNAASLIILGPDYKFTNYLSSNAKFINNGTIHGSLGLHLAGDPSFTYKRLAKLLQGLKKLHIKEITGNIYIDSNTNNISPYPSGWTKKDLMFRYGSSVTPLIIDGNYFTVTITPAKRANNLAIIKLKDPSQSIIVNNKIYTKASGVACSIHFHMTNKNFLTLRGCINIKQNVSKRQLALQNPFLYIQNLIKKILIKKNISFKGDIFLGKVMPNSLLIKNDKSPSIAKLIHTTLKQSNNLYAESLYLHAASKLNGVPVNWDQAQTSIKHLLQNTTNIDLQKAKMIDGSGLSRQNLITPLQTVNLLKFIYNNFSLSFEYIAALPIAGRDGTLQHRLEKSNQRDLIRAKTGTLQGVLSLSGYLYRKNKKTLAFAIYVNTSHPSINYRALIDKICDYLLRSPSTYLQTQYINTLKQQPKFAKIQRLKYQQNLTQVQKEKKEFLHWQKLKK